MRILISILLLVLTVFGLSCGGNSKENTNENTTPWIGSWQMVGYDSASVEDSNIVQLMNLDAQNNIHYITKTRAGEVLLENKGQYKINDQHSVLSIIEHGKVQTEYFIRKVDQDSLIFQDGKFSIKWKRID